MNASGCSFRTALSAFIVRNHAHSASPTDNQMTFAQQGNAAPGAGYGQTQAQAREITFVLKLISDAKASKPASRPELPFRSARGKELSSLRRYL